MKIIRLMIFLVNSFLFYLMLFFVHVIVDDIINTVRCCCGSDVNDVTVAVMSVVLLVVMDIVVVDSEVLF